MIEVKVRDVLKEFWRYVKPYKFWMVFFTLVVIVNNILQVIVPLYYKDLFDILAQGSPSDSGVIQELIVIIVTILGINAITFVLFRMSGFLDAFTSTRIKTDMDKDMFARLQMHSYKFFTDSFAGGLMRKIKRFSLAYDTITMVFYWNALALFVTIAGSLYILFGRNFWLGFISLIAMSGIIIANLLFSMWKLKYDITRAKKDTEASAALVDAITNNVNVKLFSGQRFENSFYGKIRDQLRKAELVSWLLAEGSFAFQSVLMVAVEFIVMYVAIMLWKDGLLTIGDFALIQAYLIGLFERIFHIGRAMRRIYESFADAKEIVEIVQTPIGVKDKPTAKRLKVTEGRVQFIDVDFNYNQTRKTLKKFNITIKPSERVALVGPSGAGKSTAVKLLMRFHDVTAGKILIDGQNISDVTQNSLRDAIGFVPQDPILFHRTLKENIRYGNRKATDKEVIAASKMARCHSFIKELPDSYDTYVGERGIKLSGGERQRVAIARAILKNAPILVLDEATSSLDSESEALIQEALKVLMKDKTVIVIAHRLSTIMQMDRILVIDNGKVTDEGSHQDLLKHEGLYQKLWNIQAGSFLK